MNGDALILEHLGLADRIAGWLHRVKGNKGGVIPLEDMIGAAREGLIQAARRWRQQDACFETFAFWRIKGNILDEIRRYEWGTRTVKPILVYINDDRHWDDGSFERWLENRYPSIFRHPGPRESAENEQVAARLIHEACRLEPRQTEIILRHYWGGEELQKIAADQGYVKSRASQLRAAGCKIIRERLNGDFQ